MIEFSYIFGKSFENLKSSAMIECSATSSENRLMKFSSFGDDRVFSYIFGKSFDEILKLRR